MKARMLWGGMLSVIFSGLFLATATTAQVTSATAPASTASAPAARPVIAVKSAEELIKALGPDRILELAPGDYNLSQLKRGVSPSYKWRETIAGEFELVIRNAPNLTLRGTGPQPAHLVINDEYATVLSFENCDHLELIQLRLGHAVQKGACTGGVVKITGSNAVHLERCDLYGSGIDGLELEKLENFSCVDSIIEDCSYGFLTGADCQGLRFEKCTFRQCVGFYGFDLKDCTRVELADCTIADNQISEQGNPLFKTNLSDKDLAMRLTGGTIRHNAATALVGLPEMLVVENATIEGNAWQAAPQVKRARGTRISQPNGSTVYTTDLGELNWPALAAKIYGDADRYPALRAANPTIKEPLWPDQKIIVPQN